MSDDKVKITARAMWVIARHVEYFRGLCAIMGFTTECPIYRGMVLEDGLPDSTLYLVSMYGPLHEIEKFSDDWMKSEFYINARKHLELKIKEKLT